MEWLAALALALIGAGIAYLKGRQKGRTNEQHSAQARDRARADRIRTDVERARDGGLHAPDRRYRD